MGKTILERRLRSAETYVTLLEKQVEKLEAKAFAYDRLMSHGLSMKELANVLKHPVAIENDDNQNELFYFGSVPHIAQYSDGTRFWSCNESRRRKWNLPRQLVYFNGEWEQSLTLPDGYHEN